MENKMKTNTLEDIVERQGQLIQSLSERLSRFEESSKKGLSSQFYLQRDNENTVGIGSSIDSGNFSRSYFEMSDKTSPATVKPIDINCISSGMYSFNDTFVGGRYIVKVFACF